MKKKYTLISVFFFVLYAFISFSQVPPPKITSFTPTSGPVGTTVQITGQYFNSTLANNVVYFGATKATVTAVSANTNTLTVTVPAGATYNYITDIDPTYPGMFYSIKPFLPTFSCGGLISASSFGTKTDFTAGSSPYCVATADFDGDGKADVAVVNENSNTVSVFRNTSTSGKISFAAKVDFTTASVPLGV